MSRGRNPSQILKPNRRSYAAHYFSLLYLSSLTFFLEAARPRGLKRERKEIVDWVTEWAVAMGLTDWWARRYVRASCSPTSPVLIQPLPRSLLLRSALLPSSNTGQMLLGRRMLLQIHPGISFRGNLNLTPSPIPCSAWIPCIWSLTAHLRTTLEFEVP